MIQLPNLLPYLHVPRRLLASTTSVDIKPNVPAAAYQPKLVEQKKYDNWEKYNCFTAENQSAKPRFSMVLPPPNITGNLHLGHALACTVQDVIARHKRATGHNVLWLPGIDHAGIATQGVVERHLKTMQNVDRKKLGREKFVKEVWKWKERHGENIFKQLRVLGCSLDWTRQVFTLDPNHTLAVNTAFIKLFKKGLIYRKKALVNWCTALNSTVSDIEVDNIELFGEKELQIPGYEQPVKFGLMYYIAYKLFDSDEEIVVATTTPETILGDTAIAVHPDDERYLEFKQRQVMHPFRDITIPIIFDDFVDMNLGTGAVKITPAHSKIDYEIGTTHNIPLVQVIGEDGLIQNSDQFNGLPRYECRQMIVKYLEEMGLLRDIKSHHMILPVCSRTGDVINHLPKEQWFLNCSKLNDKANELVDSGLLKIVPDKYLKNWKDWTADDRDWCISRQLWWGHQIPAYKCKSDRNVVWVAATNEASAKAEASKHLRAMPDTIEAERDSDVLDTWFSSGIYPFAALGWPSSYHHVDFRRFYPLNLMATGNDILGFWVHRMVMLGVELTGELPFNKVLLHGVVCDNKGAKMSKSRGNVIDPVDIINGISLEKLTEKTKEMHRNGTLNKEELFKAYEYHQANFSKTKGIPECGVDALRFTLLTQDIKSQFINFDIAQCFSNKLFCNKIWQAVKYSQLACAKLDTLDEEITKNDLTYFDKWVLSRLSNMVEKVCTAMSNYDFHIATKAIRSLMYNEFCDVYVEATKPAFLNKELRQSYAHAHTLSAVLNTSLRCLAPFMIYLTDELIPRIPAFSNNIIHNFKDSNNRVFDFPEHTDFKKWRDGYLERQVGRLLSTVDLIREVRGLYNISNKFKPYVYIKTLDGTLTTDIVKHKPIVLNLTRCNDIDFKEKTDTKFVTASLDKDTTIFVELLGEDVELAIFAAKSKLEKRIKKIEESLSKLEAKFSSGHYLSSAPEWTQHLEREKMEKKKRELQELQKLM